MKLLEIFTRKGIDADLSATDKLGVLRQMAHLAELQGADINSEEFTEVLLERESLGSTGIGGGIAIPHGKMGGIRRTVIVFGRSIKGVDFEAVDSRPCHLFFLLAAPDGSAGLHLKALARISRLLRNEDFRQRLLEAPDGDAIWETIRHEDGRV